MSIHHYAYQGTEERIGKAVGRNLPISTKYAIEICNAIRGRTIPFAQRRLAAAIAEKQAIPLRRFSHNVGHRAGIGSGRYMVKACTEISKIIDSAVKNAQYHGLSTTHLIIHHIAAQLGSREYHMGRQRRRQRKQTHVEVIVIEGTAVTKKTRKTSSAEHSSPIKKTTHEATA